MSHDTQMLHVWNNYLPTFTYIYPKNGPVLVCIFQHHGSQLGYINGLVIKSISQPEVCNTCCMNMSKFHDMSIYTIYSINIQY